jgi:hypothetical protein
MFQITYSFKLRISWTNFSWQDNSWAKFSTLEVAACHTMHLIRSIALRPNLELKTRLKQLLGSLPLDITLPAYMLSPMRMEYPMVAYPQILDLKGQHASFFVKYCCFTTTT